MKKARGHNEKGRGSNLEKKSALSDLLLLLVAMIWGAGFSATQLALEAGLSAALILALRFGVAAIALGAICWKQVVHVNGREWACGALSGLFLFAAFCLQTEAQRLTTPSNCAFLTTTNVVMVPFLVWAVTRRRPETRHLLLPLLALLGVFVLGYAPGQGLRFGAGDVLALLCALFFAAHIASLQFTAQRVEARRLTFIQMTTAAGLALLYFLAADRAPVRGAQMRQGLLPVLYLGLFSTCLCFFMQTAAQKRASAAQAAIFLSLEGVFGSLFSVCLGFEPFTWNLALGGGLLFFAAALSELPARRRA